MVAVLLFSIIVSFECEAGELRLKKDPYMYRDPDYHMTRSDQLPNIPLYPSHYNRSQCSTVA